MNAVWRGHPGDCACKAKFAEPLVYLLKYLVSVHVKQNVLNMKSRLGMIECKYSKTYLKQPLKNRQNKGLKDKWLLKAA